MGDHKCACLSTDARRCYENRYMPLMDDFQRSRFEEDQQCDPQECECGCHDELIDDYDDHAGEACTDACGWCGGCA